MWPDMCMAGEDIAFTMDLEVGWDISFYIFLMEITTLILAGESIFFEKEWYQFEMFLDKCEPFFPIETVNMSFFCEASIPKIEIFPLCFSFSNFFEECISLTHYPFIFSLYHSKLGECPIKDTIDIIPSDRWCEIEEIHIKGWYEYGPVWEWFSVFLRGHLYPLDSINISSILSREWIYLFTDFFSIVSRKRGILRSRCLEIVKRSTWEEVDALEDMCFSRTICPDDREMAREYDIIMRDSAEVMDVE